MVPLFQYSIQVESPVVVVCGGSSRGVVVAVAMVEVERRIRSKVS